MCRRPDIHRIPRTYDRNRYPGRRTWSGAGRRVRARCATKPWTARPATTLDVAPLNDPFAGAKLSDNAKAVGLTPKAMGQYRRVAATWPEAQRNQEASWSVHAVLASQSDRTAHNHQKRDRSPPEDAVTPTGAALA